MKILFLFSLFVVGSLAYNFNRDVPQAENNKYLRYYDECNAEIPAVRDNKSYRKHLACMGRKFNIVDDQGMMHTSELRSGLEGIMNAELAESAIQRCVMSTQETHDAPTIELLYCLDKMRRNVQYNPIGKELDD